ncbi:hypothetical protein SAMN05421640_1208 [Ekhidna lutea]|uniref:Uncharacterized protein n=1 Tax=Ekhidna lutea TaxID=447679 RepID=A0A239HA06_EKHLU|nr:hypothetical protein SAMN05421640_1208 [Ekhidna lutea]
MKISISIQTCYPQHFQEANQLEYRKYKYTLYSRYDSGISIYSVMVHFSSTLMIAFAFILSGSNA